MFPPYSSAPLQTVTSRSHVGLNGAAEQTISDYKLLSTSEQGAGVPGASGLWESV